MLVVSDRRPLAAVLAALLVVAGAWAMARGAAEDDSTLIARVKSGPFKVRVNTAGELRARNFLRITAPANAQSAAQYHMRIASLVPEGTFVKEGDVVAVLDRAGIASTLADVNTALRRAQAQGEQAGLDATLNLSRARDEIRTLELELEQKTLAKEQALHEARTVKRRAEIDYEKARWALEQAKNDYLTKTSQAQAKTRNVGADRERLANQARIVQEVLQGFTVRAPASGIVIYEREWDGKKRTVGSLLSPWDPTVATLPDLSQMESLLYVNEHEIRKISLGQTVEITLDADRSRKLTGTVTYVSSFGAQRPSTNFKVFEVTVLLNRSDPTLLPGMTTSNSVETEVVQDALFIPIEAVYVDSGVTVVYKKERGALRKQEIETGTRRDDEVVVVRGLEEDDRVLIAEPPDAETMKIARLSGSKPKPIVIPTDSPRPTVLESPYSGAGSKKSRP